MSNSANESPASSALRTRVVGLVSAVLAAAVVLAIGAFLVVVPNFPYGNGRSTPDNPFPKLLIVTMLAIGVGVVTYASMSKSRAAVNIPEVFVKPEINQDSKGVLTTRVRVK